MLCLFVSPRRIEHSRLHTLRVPTSPFPLPPPLLASSKSRQAQGDFTHEWTVYVRGPSNENLTVYIKQINIHLHSTFTQPVRMLMGPIYEVTEYGWGEFEVKAEVG